MHHPCSKRLHTKTSRCSGNTHTSQSSNPGLTSNMKAGSCLRLVGRL